MSGKLILTLSVALPPFDATPDSSFCSSSIISSSIWYIATPASNFDAKSR